MQYYKLLAKEVEKRIDLLKPYVTDSDTGSLEDKTDAPDLPPDYDPLYQCTKQDVQDVYDINIAISKDNLCRPEPFQTVTSNLSKDRRTDSPDLCHQQNFVIDLSVNINDCGKDLLEKVRNPQLSDPPERDYNNTPKKKVLCSKEKELLTDTDDPFSCKKPKEITEDLLSFKFDFDNVVLNQSDPLPDMSMEDGPSSLSAKSFTGSLNNIHRESQKETSSLLRQSSYTVLNPSPQLIAHLKVQSLSTGVDVTSISMSESLSNINGYKKRRSWDLESAKVKWSSMALELKQKKVVGTKPNVNKNIPNKTPPARKLRNTSPIRASSVVPDKNRRGSLPNKQQPKSEPIQRANKSPVRNIASNRTIVKEQITKPNQKTLSQKPSPKQSPNQSPNQSPTKQSPNQTLTKKYFPINKSPNLPPNLPLNRQPVSKQDLNQIISNSEDPAERVRELYEKIQNQQLQQMNNLIEKQRREQMLLQQVFEEQNSILYKQLKTICPKSPIEVKEAWGDKFQHTPDRGPVSLSQLINHKPETRAESPISSTLTDTQNNLNKCDTVLNRSRNLTASMKRQSRRSPPAKPRSDKSPTDGSRTRTHSPSYRPIATSRRLNYDTSPSPVSDFGATSVSREFEPLMTDRTNDTMAGLNVSFPTDSDDCPAAYNSGYSQCGGKEITMIHCPQPSNVAPRSSTDSAIRVMEQTIQDSMNTMPYHAQSHSAFYKCPSPQEVSTLQVFHCKYL